MSNNGRYSSYKICKNSTFYCRLTVQRSFNITSTKFNKIFTEQCKNNHEHLSARLYFQQFWKHIDCFRDRIFRIRSLGPTPSPQKLLSLSETVSFCTCSPVYRRHCSAPFSKSIHPLSASSSHQYNSGLCVCAYRMRSMRYTNGEKCRLKQATITGGYTDYMRHEACEMTVKKIFKFNSRRHRTTCSRIPDKVYWHLRIYSCSIVTPGLQPYVSVIRIRYRKTVSVLPFRKRRCRSLAASIQNENFLIQSQYTLLQQHTVIQTTVQQPPTAVS